MTQVLARKWRPRIFSELVGQEHVVRALTNALQMQRLHHAYLFTGTRGVGKTTLARIIAKALNCETGVTAEPCGKCAACTEIDAGRFVDLLELDAASNRGIAEMTTLLEQAVYAPTIGRFKVYIIDEVHQLTTHAFNAMLKTLEEPPPHVKFILATTEPQKIPVTVLSRCLQFNLKQIPQPQIKAQLQKILDAEGVGFESPALALLARAAQGSMRDSLSLLDQAIAHGGGRVEEAAVRAMLGVVDQTYLYAIMRALAARDGAGLIAEADRMADRSLSFEMALQNLGIMLHRLALLQAVPGAVGADDPDRGMLEELAGSFDAEDLQLYYQIALQGRNDIGLAPDDYAGFTMTLLRMLAFAPEHSGTAARAAPGRAAGPLVPVTPAVLAESKKNDSNAAWGKIIEQLGLSGMARVLAQHCELVSRDETRIELTIAKVHERLLDKPYQDKLKAVLQQRFGAALRITISIGTGDGNGNSPAELADREKQQRQARAVAAIEQDPFVRELVENFDARIIESTIKPTQ
ncbi:MAG: DNA polymerase III, subunit gamma and tau [Betaproteobacteria bacterium RIFCSPLOWO2_12_FULL_62_58]|nr:MAG: DNA polymerase III, subunit gamma and tau [Betaproteobacteria bacterium RIFCSPLOWO2_12_FULL_62_58]